MQGIFGIFLESNSGEVCYMGKFTLNDEFFLDWIWCEIFWVFWEKFSAEKLLEIRFLWLNCVRGFLGNFGKNWEKLGNFGILIFSDWDVCGEFNNEGIFFFSVWGFWVLKNGTFFGSILWGVYDWSQCGGLFFEKMVGKK